MAVKWYLSPDDTSWDAFWEKTSIEEEARAADDEYPGIIDAMKGNGSDDQIILDGGCGLGRWLLYLSRQGYKNLIGVDFIRSPLSIIKEYNKTIHLAVGGVDCLPVESSSIDLYVSMGVIEHFEEGPQKALEEAHRVLKDGGRMLLTVPYLNLYRSTFRRFVTMPLLKMIKPAYRNKNRIFYQYYYSRKNLQNFLATSGFEISEWFYHDYYHTKNIRIGLYLEFPFLRKKEGDHFEINGIGRFLAGMTEFFSQGIFASGIAFIAKKI